MVQLLMILSFLLGIGVGVYATYKLIIIGINELIKDSNSGVVLSSDSTKFTIYLDKFLEFSKKINGN